MKLVTSVCLVVVLTGCAYYNGLYNANRLAHEAEKARSDGRPGEARSLWAQAAEKAGRVADRYPDSKWRDDALLLEGRGLAESNSCSGAVDPLQLAVDSSPDPEIRQEARFLLGRCHLALLQPDSAWSALSPLVGSLEPGVRLDSVLLLRGRAALARGAFGAALRDLRRSNVSAARYERALALSGLGRPREAAQELEALVEEPYDEDRWLAILDSLGRRSPQISSDLVDALGRQADLSAGARARLLLADGERWAAGGELGKATRRFREVAGLAPDSLEGRLAEAHLLLNRIRSSRSLDSMEIFRAELSEAIAEGGEVLRILTPASRSLETALDTGTGRWMDVRSFLAAEVLRDTLGADHLAAAVFRQFPDSYPTSSFVPKALIASASLEPGFRDSLVVVLREEYPESPYTLAYFGEAGDRFELLEDSMAILTRAIETEERLLEQRRMRERQQRDRQGLRDGGG